MNSLKIFGKISLKLHLHRTSIYEPLDKGPLLTEIVQPLLKSDIDLALKGAQGAPGPDRTQWHALKSKTEELAQRFNYYLATGKIPNRLLKGKTTLIPKDLDNINNPTKYRPITVSSTIVRLFHKVLAKRLEKHLSIDEFQRDFRSGDGISLNLQLLQSAINKAKTKYKNLSLCFIDVSKAFDSVSHESLIVAGRRLGMPDVFLKYISNMYSNSTTQLSDGKDFSGEIKVTRGIRQGDTMSVNLFNAVVDLATSELNKSIGFTINESKKIQFLSFVDDLVLFADGIEGLQRNLDTLIKEFARVGLVLNAAKCASLVITSHRKKWVCNTRSTLKVIDTNMPAMSINDAYKYLGVMLGAKGTNFSKKEKLDQIIK